MARKRTLTPTPAGAARLVAAPAPAAVPPIAAVPDAVVETGTADPVVDIAPANVSDAGLGEKIEATPADAAPVDAAPAPTAILPIEAVAAAIVDAAAADPVIDHVPEHDLDEEIEVTLLTGMSGIDKAAACGDPWQCNHAEAVRLVAAGFAELDGLDQQTAIELLELAEGAADAA